MFDGGLTARFTGGGPAGDISIEAGTLIVDHGTISTSSLFAEGGRITIAAQDLVEFINAEATSTGVLPIRSNSIITVSSPTVVLNASQVQSLTGAGVPIEGSGEVRITGDLTVISADSDVAASSTVQITGQETDLGTQLIALEGTVVDTAPLRERCSVRRDVGVSSFTKIGRGGLPASPDASLRSAYRDASPEASMDVGSESAASRAGTQASMLHLTGCAGAP